MNMSYCQYENTAADMNQVVADLEERVSMQSYLCEDVPEFNREDTTEKLSESERSASRRLYDLCQRYCQLMEESEEKGDI